MTSVWMLFPSNLSATVSGLKCTIFRTLLRSGLHAGSAVGVAMLEPTAAYTWGDGVLQGSNSPAEQVSVVRLRFIGPSFDVTTGFLGIVIPIIKIRRPWDRLIFIMGITILAKRHLFIGTHLMLQAIEAKWRVTIMIVSMESFSLRQRGYPSCDACPTVIRRCVQIGLRGWGLRGAKHACILVYRGIPAGEFLTDSLEVSTLYRNDSLVAGSLWLDRVPVSDRSAWNNMAGQCRNQWYPSWPMHICITRPRWDNQRQAYQDDVNFHYEENTEAKRLFSSMSCCCSDEVFYWNSLCILQCGIIRRQVVMLRYLTQGLWGHIV